MWLACGRYVVGMWSVCGRYVVGNDCAFTVLLYLFDGLVDSLFVDLHSLLGVQGTIQDAL